MESMHAVSMCDTQRTSRMDSALRSWRRRAQRLGIPAAARASPPLPPVWATKQQLPLGSGCSPPCPSVDQVARAAQERHDMLSRRCTSCSPMVGLIEAQQRGGVGWQAAWIVDAAAVAIDHGHKVHAALLRQPPQCSRSLSPLITQQSPRLLDDAGKYQSCSVGGRIGDAIAPVVPPRDGVQRCQLRPHRLASVVPPCPSLCERYCMS